MGSRRFIRRPLPGCVLFACALVACGGESDDPSMSEAHGDDHEMDMALDDDFVGCPEQFDERAPGLEVMGDDLVVNVVSARPDEPERYINNWKLELTGLDGSPATDAEVVRGQTFMPIHGHDGRVEPQMKRLSRLGEFEVDRLNFTMRGPWEVRLWLRSATVDDEYVVFHVCVAK